MASSLIRLLVVSHWFPRHDGDWGGIFVLEQVKALRAEQIDARVIVAEPTADMAWRRPHSVAAGINAFTRAPAPQWQVRSGVPVAHVPFLAPHPRFWGALAPRSLVASLARWRRRLLADFEPDIVHAHTAFLDGHAAAWLARKLRVPMVLTEGTGPFTTLTGTASQRRLTEAAVNSATL